MICSTTQRCNIVATLFLMLATLFQHCNAVLQWKSSLRIVRVTSPLSLLTDTPFMFFLCHTSDASFSVLYSNPLLWSISTLFMLSVVTVISFTCFPRLVQGPMFWATSLCFLPLDSRTRTSTSTRFDLKFFRVFSKYRLPGKLHFTIFHQKS